MAALAFWSPRRPASLPRRVRSSSASSHSRSGAEHQVIPAPVPKRSTWPVAVRSIQKARMPTAGSLVRGRRRPSRCRPPQYRPRSVVSSASMIRRALDLGAPVTESGGKVAASSSGWPAPPASSPRTVQTRCTGPGCCGTAHSAGHGHPRCTRHGRARRSSHRRRGRARRRAGERGRARAVRSRSGPAEAGGASEGGVTWSSCAPRVPARFGGLHGRCRARGASVPAYVVRASTALSLAPFDEVPFSRPSSNAVTAWSMSRSSCFFRWAAR